MDFELRKSETVNAAIKLLMFTKLNEYPAQFTFDFFKLTDLLNDLENALYKDGIVNQDIWKKL